MTSAATLYGADVVAMVLTILASIRTDFVPMSKDTVDQSASFGAWHAELPKTGRFAVRYVQHKSLEIDQGFSCTTYVKILKA